MSRGDGVSRIDAWGRGIGLALVAGAALLLLLFIVLPLLALFLHTTPSTLLADLGQPEALGALALSLQTTATTLVLILVLGTPAAYLLARCRFPGRRIADSLVDLPIVLPPAVAGLALLIAFGRIGLLGPALSAAGLRIAFTTTAVVMAQFFVACPFYIRAARTGFAGVDRTLEEAAATLGSGGWGAFWRVTVPLARPSLVSGAILAWTRALGEFGATIFFAGNNGGTETMPILIYVKLDAEGDIDTAVALSAVLVVVSLVVLLLVRWSGRDAVGASA